MTFDNIQHYLQEHEAQKLTIGKSGADVYDIDGNYILKHVRRELLREKELFDLYQKESVFYQVINEQNLCCIPKVLVNKRMDDEIVILMKKYQTPLRDCIDESFLFRVMQALASVHSCEIPSFLSSLQTAANPLTTEQIADCIMGWKKVLNEHPRFFDDSVIDEVAERINDLIIWHNSTPKVLCHGDFHMDNLLLDTDNTIIICDWQGVGCGDVSGDLSFFISRLDSDGITVDKQHLVDLYAKAVFEKSAMRVDKDQILGHMYAANTITSFVFWHEYLHNTTKERVKRIYNEMQENFRLSVRIL